MKKMTVLLLLLNLLLTACPDDGNNANTTNYTPVTPYNDPYECDQLTYDIGIPGNEACPYKGEFDPYLGYQTAAIYYSFGVSFKIDFGWDYRDNCPTPGQLPIFKNGTLVRCDQVNPTYAQDDYTHTGECTGDQYNAGLTGCRPNLQPGPGPGYFPQSPDTTTDIGF